jgi:hypothetical protein
MPKKWRGDRSNLLPAHQVEPYRLWFEFLQLASKDADISVDHSLYIAWGNYQSSTFDAWWSSHWRKLFAVNFGARELIDRADIKSVGEREIVIAVPLYQSPSKTASQVRQLLEGKGAKERISDAPMGSFRPRALDADGNEIPTTHRFLKNLGKIRLYLRLYRYWVANSSLSHRKRLEQTAINYFEWAQAWNRKVSAKRGDKRPRAELPGCISGYVTNIRARTNKELGNHDDGNHRRQYVRYLRKAVQIARNVGIGVFPGHYEKPGNIQVPNRTEQD